MKNQYQLLNEILSDIEKDAIAQFMGNDTMREAVKKVLLCGVYYNGILKKDVPADPLRNYAIGLAFNDPSLSNEAIGADLRASIAGINTLEVAFDTMKSLVPVPASSKSKGENQAR